jgi:hypothetical protein
MAAMKLDVGRPPYLPASFSNADLTLVANAVLNKCDGVDGVDGIIVREAFKFCAPGRVTWQDGVAQIPSLSHNSFHN